MYSFVQNSNSSLRFCLNVLKFVGFLMPYEPRKNMKIYLMAYWVSWFMFLVGFIIIAQAGEMFQIWGDIPLMTSASFLLFTNLALGTKMINVVARRRKIQAIIDEAEEELMAEDRKEGVEIVKNCNRGTSACLYVYIWLSAMTVFGWACSAEKNQLPLRAWYPYDTSKSPVYELTYANQSSALVISALVNVCLDTLVTSLIALCRCRLRLVRLSLRTLCDGVTTNGKSSALVISALVNVCLDTLVTSLIALCRCRLRLVRLSLRTLCDGVTTNGKSSALVISALVNVCLDTLVTSLIALCRCRLRLVRLSLRTLCDGVTTNGKQLMSSEAEMTVYCRLQSCVLKHESALKAASRIQACFTEPILTQFTVSTVIICVTAYQLAMELKMRHWIRIISMVAYLFCMMLQVFLYCYQGNQLTEESSGIAGATYECPWYTCSARLRRALLIVMLRSRRVAKLTAGGFTTLSLASYMSIIKVSYTFFTVLRKV